MIIYKTTNLINGKIYVGKDKRNLDSYLGSGLILKYAIEKYGRENFKKEILEKCDSNDLLCEREIYWIKELNATDKNVGYNIALGGAGGDTYTNNPNYDKIVEKLTGENNGFYGKTHSNETIAKIIKNRIGKPAWNSGKKSIYSEETISKMKLAHSKIHIEIDLEKFKSMLNTHKKSEIEKILNISSSVFYRCVKQISKKSI